MPTVQHLLARRILPGASSGVPDASVDLILSNSVIEHVLDVEELVAELDRVAAPGGVQYHFVDFSDHRAQVDRFTALYGHHPDEIRALSLPVASIDEMKRQSVPSEDDLLP